MRNFVCLRAFSSRCNIKESRLENCKESCVFVDHDAYVKIARCTLHSADAGLMLNDRAHVEVSGSDMRLMHRGAIGQVRCPLRCARALLRFCAFIVGKRMGH